MASSVADREIVRLPPRAESLASCTDSVRSCWSASAAREYSGMTDTTSRTAAAVRASWTDWRAM